jgi:hypothetical protein
MVDGTLSEPFFPRNPDGSLKERVESGFHEEHGMLEALPLDDDWLSEASDGEEEWDLESRAGSTQQSAASTNESTGRKRIEVDSKMFHKVQDRHSMCSQC